MGTALQKTIQQLRSENREYFQIAISVDCVIFGFDNNELKVLLIKSDLEEFKDQWSLLGDLVRPDENLDNASYRVLKDRTGLDDVYLEQVYTFGDVKRHPAGRVITTAYYSLINIKDHQLKLAHNELHWHPVQEITTLAFDHQQILDTCLKQLQSRIDEHPIVFNLLPEKFSLRELQSLYEAIHGVKMDRRNFRKKFFLMGWLEDVNELEQDVPHRPGKLYRFDPTKSSAKKRSGKESAVEQE
ncbi:NUDIX domain-containing protein [Pseudoflavitalea sp. G-6-1-2]|uniref:NUDIX hydrolase n=1 Tax=Pseudoflavitalea sp. G-6-1-2 TaxID=2728841 RepID=UPI00146DDDF3|nr:NUDIX domain-containing protein [Pseudoflavitalea sp. G-6-1-2]NML20212.1 NUDIX domain-containing protein [Pseudoflavitalea sp. G-6-1-2]